MRRRRHLFIFSFVAVVAFGMVASLSVAPVEADECDGDETCICYDDFCIDVEDPCEGLDCDEAEFCDSNDDCTDDDPCIVGVCLESGVCSTTRTICNDHNRCTTDSCNPEGGCLFDGSSGCVNEPCPGPDCICQSNDDCTDDDPCTDDVCNGIGICFNTVTICNDHDQCTTDSCNSESGCVYEDASSACDDNNECTVDTCDVDSGCVNTAQMCAGPTPTATPNAVETATATSTPPEAEVPTPTTTSTPPDTAVPTATATLAPTAAPTPEPLNHFLCYESHQSPLNRAGVSLVDQFDPPETFSTVTVRRAKRLCAPASKNDEDPTAPGDVAHLTAYTIQQTSPRFKRQRDILVTPDNAIFDPLMVDLIRPDRLLVPASKLVGAQIPDPLAAPIDHYKCYRVRGARQRLTGVNLETQFGPVTVDVKRPFHLCAPADKNGEGIVDSNHALMCYQTRTATQSPLRVSTNNQFEPDTFDIFGIRELCVPANLVIN